MKEKHFKRPPFISLNRPQKVFFHVKKHPLLQASAFDNLRL